MTRVASASHETSVPPGKMGVHFSVDSSSILKVDKAESVIEVWEEYEVEVPVEPPAVADTAKENGTTKARETLEDDDADEREVRVVMTIWGVFIR